MSKKKGRPNGGCMAQRSKPHIRENKTARRRPSGAGHTPSNDRFK